MLDVLLFLPGARFDIPIQPLDEVVGFPVLLFHIKNLLNRIHIVLFIDLSFLSFFSPISLHPSNNQNYSRPIHNFI